MPILVTDNGTNNLLETDHAVIEKGSGAITFLGDNNKLSIGRCAHPIGVHLTLKDGASISIGNGLIARSLFVHATQWAVLKIGQRTALNGAVRLLMHEPAAMTIGDRCLFADEVVVTTSDMHSIVDTETGERINQAANVTIGDRVWLGMRVIVLKGVTIGSGSVIGAGSIVTRDVPENCVADGNPARVVRQNATWDFRLL